MNPYHPYSRSAVGNTTSQVEKPSTIFPKSHIPLFKPAKLVKYLTNNPLPTSSNTLQQTISSANTATDEPNFRAMHLRPSANGIDLFLENSVDAFVIFRDELADSFLDGSEKTPGGSADSFTDPVDNSTGNDPGDSSSIQVSPIQYIGEPIWSDTHLRTSTTFAEKIPEPPIDLHPAMRSMAPLSTDPLLPPLFFGEMTTAHGLSQSASIEDLVKQFGGLPSVFSPDNGVTRTDRVAQTHAYIDDSRLQVTAQTNTNNKPFRFFVSPAELVDDESSSSPSGSEHTNSDHGNKQQHHQQQASTSTLQHSKAPRHVSTKSEIEHESPIDPVLCRSIAEMHLNGVAEGGLGKEKLGGVMGEEEEKFENPNLLGIFDFELELGAFEFEVKGEDGRGE